MSPTPLASFPVAVIMARKQVSRGGWSVPVWEVSSLVSGEEFANTDRQRSLIRSAGGTELYLWTGFEVELYRDAAEMYWFNLTGGRPSLYVLCEKRDDGELVPTAITPDHLHSVAMVEADGESFAVPIPAEIHEQLERVVVEHYRPEPPRKRKRKDWRNEESG